MKVKASQAKELKNALKSISDNRKANGLRHSQASVLAIAICAVLSGCRSFLAIGEWASRCTQNMLKRLGCYFHEKKLIITFCVEKIKCLKIRGKTVVKIVLSNYTIYLMR
jgi:hypothetical protein